MNKYSPVAKSGKQKKQWKLSVKDIVNCGEK